MSDFNFNFDSVDNVPKEVLSSGGGGSFVQNWMDPGARQIIIKDIDVHVFDWGGITISMQCEETGEDLGDSGRKYSGLLGDHVAKGKYGQIQLFLLSSADKESKTGENLRDKQLRGLRADISTIAEKSGLMDKIKAIKVENNSDIAAYLKVYMKEVAKVFKGVEFYTIVNAEQKGAYDRLKANRGWVAVDGYQDKQPTGLSCYPAALVEEVIISDEDATSISHCIVLKDGDKSWFNKKEGEDTYNYAWEEGASSEKGKTPDDIGLPEPPQIPGNESTKDDLPF